VSRTTIIVLVALGAALAGFAFSSTSNQGDDEGAAEAASVAAGPQRAVLGWRETYGPAGEQLVFSVESLQVLPRGWQAHVSLENGTSISYEIVADPSRVRDRSFGLMLFATGDPDSLAKLNEGGALPAVRPAESYEPILPRILEPGDTWTGTISASGALVADSWARVVFGALISVGEAPAELGEQIVWITDNAYKLHR